MESHRIVVITGANRGLGHEFVHQLLFSETPPLQYLTANMGCTKFTVLALCRTLVPSQWDEISSKLNEFNALHEKTNSQWVQRTVLGLHCDVLDDTSIHQIKEYICNSPTIPSRIDYLISNAGVIENDPQTNISSITTFDPVITNILNINTIAPIILTNILLPLLQTAANSSIQVVDTTPLQFDSTINPGVILTPPESESSTPIQQYAQCLYLSSNMGSLAQTNMPLCPTYRSSKSALNMFVKCLSIENPTINFMPISPGWCNTDMGSRGGRSPPQTVNESVTGMFKQMNLYCFRQHSGQHLFSYDDELLPW